MKNPSTIVVFDFKMIDTLDHLDIDVVGVPKQNLLDYLVRYEGGFYENVKRLKD